MSSLLDIDVSGAQEPKVVAPNEEYEIRVLDVTAGIDKNGDPYMLPRFEIVGEPLAKDFTQFYRLPHPELDEKQLNRVNYAIQQLLEACGLPISGQIDLSDIKGHTLWAILGVKEDEQYGEQNFIKKVIVRQ